MATDTDETRRIREEDMARLRDAADAVGASKMRGGSWFRRIVKSRLERRARGQPPGTWDRLYPALTDDQRADKRIRRAARRCSIAGAIASVGTSSGELLALFTEGLGAPIGMPMAAVSMGTEAAYTALVQIDLACDLASIYGVPFLADDMGEVTTLFGLALGVDIRKRGDDDADDAHGLTARLMRLEDGEIATRIGRKLLEEAFVRNVIPVAGTAISARFNYVGTARLGAAAKRYVRYRRALVGACGRLGFHGVADPRFLIEGAWLLATVDGEAGHEEMLALALLVDQLPPERRADLGLGALGEDEERWFEALPRVAEELRGPLLDVLFLIAAADRQLAPAERRFLRRVGKALGREIDLPRVEAIGRHLARGEAPPPGFLGLLPASSLQARGAGSSRRRFDVETETFRKVLAIGSGLIEGTVRHLVGMRLDGPGMRWGKARAEAVLHLRCGVLNGVWNDFETYLASREGLCPLCQRRVRQLPLAIYVPMGGEWNHPRAEVVPCSRWRIPEERATRA